MAQLVSGFCAIMRDKNDVKTKNSMLNYMAGLMEDCHDFGWRSVKGAHAVVLCQMERINSIRKILIYWIELGGSMPKGFQIL